MTALSTFPGRAAGVVVMAPHIRVEDVTLRGIERARGKLLTINEIAQWTGDAVRTVQSRLRRNGVWASGTREENGRPVQVYEAGAYLDIRARRPA